MSPLQALGKQWKSEGSERAPCVLSHMIKGWSKGIWDAAGWNYYFSTAGITSMLWRMHRWDNASSTGWE